MSADGFASVISPVTLAGFLETYFEREPLFVGRASPRHFAGLADLDRLDTYLTATLPRLSEVLLVKFGHDQDSRAYAGAEGRIDPRRVWSMFADGWTVVFNNLHRHMPELGQLCRAAEAQFSQPFQTNLYLTPAHAQGFKPHWDTHDVFVLQVMGSKDWALYDTKLAWPLPGQSFNQNPVPPGPVSREVRLEAGDTLYVPRGLMHDARSTDEMSLHVTLGLMGKTWADLLFEALAAYALAEPSARRLLPAGYARPEFDAASAEPAFRALLSGFAAQAELGPILAQMAESFVDSRPPQVGGQARQMQAVAALSERTRLGARPDLILRGEEDGESFTIIAHGGALTLPAHAAPAARFALESAGFCAADLPGPLDLAGRLTLLRRLVGEGLVQILDA